MRLVLLEYLHMMRESGEFDILFPDLLLAMDIVPLSKAQGGVRQAGVDLAAVGKDANGTKTLWLFVLKRGDIGRSEWDSTPQSVRQSLDEIRDAYIRSHIAPEYADLPIKIVVATTGDFKQVIEAQKAGYATNNTKSGLTYEYWNGDIVAKYIEEYLLDEFTLPARQRSDLRRSLALVGETDYKLDHFFLLLRNLLGWDNDPANSKKPTKKELIKTLRTVNLSLSILCKWASNESNLKSSVIACERTLLWTWEEIRRNGFTNDKDIFGSYSRIINTYLNSTTEYFNKVLDHLVVRDALVKYYPESILLNERVFEEIGILSTLALSHLAWGMITKDEQRVEGAITVAKTLATFLQSHRISGSPYYDGQSIDISLGLFLLFATRQKQAAEKWLYELTKRLAYAFKSGKWFPISSDSFDDLVDLELNDNATDKDKLRSTSWMVPVIAQWLTLYNMQEPYKQLHELATNTLQNTDFQLWYPDDDTDNYLYFGPAHFNSGISEAPMLIPSTIEEMVQAVSKVRNESPVKDHKSTSAKNVGIQFLDFIAYRHFRTPPDPALWQNLIISESELRGE